jgi:DNA topoisomerase-3
MTPQAIRDGFDSLRSDKQMQGLADAARSRSEADWLVGINGTRAMTAFNSRDGGFFLTTVGRVQTPTLSWWSSARRRSASSSAATTGKSTPASWPRPASTPASGSTPSGRKTRRRREARRPRVERARARRPLPTPCAASRHRHRRSKPTTQASPLLFDLTSLQREANGKFGFSAKTTLALAPSLYERHKALTYPRTDSRALPEDYLPVVKQTFEMLADSGMRHLAPFAAQALNEGYIKPTKRIFDNAKVSDHFAIIPTLQAPSGLSEAEQKLYDLVVRRFMAVFFPSAEYMVTTRISRPAATASRPRARCWSSPAGWPSTARKRRRSGRTPRKATRARTWCR